MTKRRAPQRVKDNSRALHRARALLKVGGKMRDVASAAADAMNVSLPQTKSLCWALLHQFVESRAGTPLPPRQSNPEKAWLGKQHAKLHRDVNDDAFLLSYDWRSLRMRVLKKFGARCQCCGATAKDGVRIHVDHIKPRRQFPELALVEANLQVLCEECNHGKGNWDQTDWRPPAAPSAPSTDPLAFVECGQRSWRPKPVTLPDDWSAPPWWKAGQKH